jgi:hypothetical protein
MNAPGVGQSVKVRALTIMRPLVTWLLRSGVGYAEFASAIKPVFLEAALLEQQRLGGKRTDSALSLLSGLHRKDVRLLAAAKDASAQSGGQPPVSGAVKPTPASQVVTRWLTRGLPNEIPFAGRRASFEQLARSISSDFHPRSVLQEMVRLGVASEEDGRVRLRAHAFVPDARHDEARELLAASVADHIAAGVHNLTAPDAKKFLEQSVFADGLTGASARQLEQLSGSLWQQVLTSMVEAAVPLCEQDEPRGGDQRVRVGMFCYSEPMQPGQTGDGPAAGAAAGAKK